MKLLSEQTVELDGMTFTVRPQTYEDFARAMDYAEKLDISNENIRNVSIGSYSLLLRITSWTGVELSDGSVAECTDQNKMALFGQHPDLLNDLARHLGIIKEADEKNLETSQTG